jgi:hypothetical protein
MTPEEAKFILQSYRPNGRDADDPAFAEALARVESDPDLARWFEAERALDAALSAKLRAVPVPRRLRGSIMAGGKIVRPAPFWSRRAVLACASAAAVVALLAVLRPFSGGSQFADFRLHVARMIDESTYRLNYNNPQIARVRAWLKDHQGFADFVPPDSLNGRPTFGCQVFEWKGHTATLICFQSERGIVHIFTIDASIFPDAPPEGPPQIASIANQQVASWTKAGKTYVLAGIRDYEALKSLL